jgi:5-methyltetrahydropteroyltriglutamate--homocysteine methyltransferase
MAQTDNRIPVTHVGSLVRPPALIEFLRKVDGNETYDAAAFDRCLSESVADSVRRQGEAGVDIVSDGEYGKSVNWAFYVHRRLTGITPRARSRRRKRRIRRQSSSADATAKPFPNSMPNTMPACCAMHAHRCVQS